MCRELIHCWCNLQKSNGRIARSCFGGTCDKRAGETVLFHKPVPIRLISLSGMTEDVNAALTMWAWVVLVKPHYVRGRHRSECKRDFTPRHTAT